ncbi:uncharacterized protein L199_001626 [Kwoniella botswanensis]|uniref:uncharacterized protein n=1 Tax=Kwoniella botswanensis TaxID=1268659 RepID=UPI00315D092C
MSSQPPYEYPEGSEVNGHQLRGGVWYPLVATSPSRDMASEGSIPAVASPTPSTQWRAQTPSTYRNGATPYQNGRSGASQVTTPARSVAATTAYSRGHSRSSTESTRTGVFERNIVWDAERTEEGNFRLDIDFEAEHLGRQNSSMLSVFPNDPDDAVSFESWMQQTRTLGGFSRAADRMTIDAAIATQLRPAANFVNNVSTAIDQVLLDFWREYRTRP